MYLKSKSYGLSIIAALVMMLVPAAVAQGATLTAGASADVVYGSQAKTHQLLLRDNSNLGFTCSKAEMAGEVPAGGTSTPVLHPWFEGCTAFGLKATMNTTGCNYRFHLESSSGPEYPATMDLECSTAGIVLTTLTCEVVFPSQGGLSTVVGTNVSNGGTSKVLLSMSMEGIDYVVTKDGIGCPLKAKGSYSEAAYAGSSELIAPTQGLWLEP